LREQDEKQRSGEIKYYNITARAALRDIGIVGDEADDVLALCHCGGFTYCLDPEFCHDNGEYPEWWACAWGIDQLRSRVECVRPLSVTP